MRTLLLSSDLNRLGSLQEALLQRDHDLSVAREIHAALAVLDEHPFSLVIIDASQNLQDAANQCERIRSHAVGRTSVILAVVSDSHPEILNTLLDAGMDFYICLEWEKEVLVPHLFIVERLVNHIFKRVRAEEAFWSAEQHFRTLAEESPNMIFINSGGKVVYANQACERIMEYSREEFYAPDFDFRVLIAPEYQEQLRTNYLQHLKGSADLITSEYELITRTGKRIYAIHNTKLIEYQGKTAVLGIVTDISSYRLLMAELKASEQRFRYMAENAPVGVFQTTLDGMVKYVNRHLAEEMGYMGPEHMQGSDVRRHYKNPKERIAMLDMLARDGMVHGLELELVTLSGKEITALLHAVVEEETLTGILINITPRKYALRALEEREALLHSIVESIPFDVFALDMEDRYTLQNSTCKAHWGDVIGKHPREIAPDKEILGRWLSNNQRASSGKIVDEVVHYPVGDSVQHLRNIISPIWDKGSITGIVGVNIDVTDATLAHAELERKESLYRAIVDSFPDPIILCNPSGLLITINLPASRALGYPYPMNAAKEAIQCTDIFLCDDPSGIENTIEEVFRSRKLKTMECRLRKRDGSDILSNVESLPLYTREGDPLAILNIFRFQKSNSA